MVKASFLVQEQLFSLQTLLSGGHRAVEQVGAGDSSPL